MVCCDLQGREDEEKGEASSQVSLVSSQKISELLKAFASLYGKGNWVLEHLPNPTLELGIKTRGACSPPRLFAKALLHGK